MIKNTLPEFEQLIARGASPVTPALSNFLQQAGLTCSEQEGNFLWQREADLLDEQAVLDQIQAMLPPGYDRQVLLEIHRTVGSTNDEVMTRLSEPGQNLIVCTAEMQTAGKGRRGRTWVSPFGRNIYLTLGYFHEGEASELGGLSLIAGMKLVEVLRGVGIAGAGLKWPNDVLLDGGKMAGILVELKPREKRGVGVVLGMGVNLQLSMEDGRQIDQPWSAAGGDLQLSRSELTGRLAAEVVGALEAFTEQGFAPFARAWPTFNLYAGREVRIIRGGVESEGIDRGVDENGNLLLETAHGVERHNAGEVSLRPVAS